MVMKDSDFALQIPGTRGRSREASGAGHVRRQAPPQHGGLPAVAPLRLLRPGDGEGAAGAGWGRGKTLHSAPGHRGLRLGPGKPRVRGYPARGRERVPVAGAGLLRPGDAAASCAWLCPPVKYQSAA